MNDRKLLHALLRQDLALFNQRVFRTLQPGNVYLHNWHLDAIAFRLKQVMDGKIQRLIITMPPRSGKSLAVSVGFPAFLLGHDPSIEILCASYSSDLSTMHALDTRKVMQSPWYQACFPGTRLSGDRNTQQEITTTRHGVRLATSVGGTVTGRGGRVILLDDLHKPEEAESDVRRENVIRWYQSTLLSRLNNKLTDPIVLVQQRVHEADIVGHLLEQAGWVHLDLPAIAESPQRIQIGENDWVERAIGDVLHPEREPLPTLMALKQAMGSYAFAAQYQQQPVPSGGGLVKWDWFEFYDDLPLPANNHVEIVQSWDTAVKAGDDNDYSVCTTWHCIDDKFYLVDVFRERLEFPALQSFIPKHYAQHGATRVLIEDQGAGSALIQALRQDGSMSVIDIRPEGDKATRLMSVSPKVEGKQVLLPRKAHWLGDFQNEMTRFPKGKHDDQVDSFSQFLNWAIDNYTAPGESLIFVGYSRMQYEMADRAQQEFINREIHEGRGCLVDYGHHDDFAYLT